MIIKHLYFSFRFYKNPTVSNLFFYRQYKTIASTYKNESRYFAPGSIQWTNNSYSYNNSMMDLPFHNRSSNKILKNYFNLNIHDNYKRLPIYFLLKIFVKNYFSLPAIKNTNNKSIVTLYVYNREKRYIINEFFFLRNLLAQTQQHKQQREQARIQRRKQRSLRRQSLQLLSPPFYSNLSEAYIKSKKYIEPKKHIEIKNFIETKKNRNLSSLQKDYNRYLLEAFIRDVKKITLFLSKKKLIFRTILFHLFLKWALSILGIKILISTTSFTNRKGRILNYIKNIKILRGKYSYTYIFKKRKTINVWTLGYINLILVRYLKQFYKNKNKNIRPLYNIKLLYNIFRYKYSHKIQNTYFNNELLALRYISILRLQINKLDNYIPIIKFFLKKILNKKIEINVVDLNYFYMNSNMYSQISSLTLKNKSPTVSSLKKINKLVKIQRIDNNKYTIDYNNIFTKKINLNNNSNKNYKDILYKTVQTMFRKNLNNNLNKKDIFSSNKLWQTNVNSALNLLKHKWVTGVRVEAKGRLSKKFGAVRSKYMDSSKGHLRIMQYITDPDLDRNDKLLHPPSVALVRGQYTSNLQYSSVSSKIRAGAFGVKGWVSSN